MALSDSRSRARSQNAGSISAAYGIRASAMAATLAEHIPPNGSHTISPRSEQASMMRAISSKGF